MVKPHIPSFITVAYLPHRSRPWISFNTSGSLMPTAPLSPRTTMPRIFYLVTAFTLGCHMQSTTTASAPNGSAASARELDLRGDFKGPLGVQLYSVRNAIGKDVPGTL